MPEKTQNNPIPKEARQHVSDNAALARTVFLLFSVVGGVVIMAFAFWIAKDPAVRDPSILNWQGAIGVEILVAVGTSIIASIIFYRLYSQTAEDRIVEFITFNTSKTATEYATSLFTNRFKAVIPAKIYPETIMPSFEYYQDITEAITTSQTYWYKGDTASYTSWRLDKLAYKNLSADKKIILLLLDPRCIDLFEERATIELNRWTDKPTKMDLKARASQIREEVFVTMLALFDLSHLLRVDLAFHTEHLFFVSQLVDSGVFLSYYTGGEFPSDYFYPKETFTYKAFLLNSLQNFNASSLVISFRPGIDDNEFQSHLTELGCELTIDQLQEKKKERFKRYEQITPFHELRTKSTWQKW